MSPWLLDPPPARSVTVVIPVFNEEGGLASSLERLVGFLCRRCPWPWEVVIADNGSTDRTFSIAQELASRLAGVHAGHRSQKGRGGALRSAWGQSQAAVLSYMDVDLSSDLESFPRLVGPLLDGKFDLATGSRLARGASTHRCLKREFISRAYNLLLKRALRTRFSDAQCGFKAITREAADRLLPLVRDDSWFFDTELLVRAEKSGYRILDLPVAWEEGPHSRVKLWRTAREDLAGILRLRREIQAARLARCQPPLNGLKFPD